MSDSESELILRPNRIKYVGLLISALLFVAGGVFTVEHGSFFTGWAAIIFFGSGAIAFAALLLRGSAYLKLTTEGFIICSLFKPHFYRWHEVDRFVVGRIVTRKSVGFNYSDSYRRLQSLRKFNSSLVGFEGRIARHLWNVGGETCRDDE
jgi:hypothetical protein